jgi:hypothetical protein
MRSLVAAVALLLASSASGGRSKALGALPRCPSVTLVATGEWSQIQQGDGFALRMPDCFRNEEGPRFVHGGQRWQCDAMKVEVVWGMWGPGSFGERKECRMSLAGVPAMVATASGANGVSVLVWYLTGTIHEPIISTHSAKADDLPVLTSVAYSGQLSVPRGPNR